MDEDQYSDQSEDSADSAGDYNDYGDSNDYADSDGGYCPSDGDGDGGYSPSDGDGDGGYCPSDGDGGPSPDSGDPGTGGGDHSWVDTAESVAKEVWDGVQQFWGALSHAKPGR